ncbi:Acyltransferase [Gemella bergeri ATCC 700627]|uniref:Acyltransferase n=1 Tax=Gemella bergeri ATCC 700627 TaxID=1321820 RepID=U2S357_9BACL|nr:lysophospholipid acyltransferase family protein [Gemella bergeri]ERK60148.1 Acyltransferase [Gemella bergeri ATCC 700627]
MYKFIKILLSIYYRIFYKVTIINGSKIENAKGIVISGNHLSNHDPLLFPAFFTKNIRFIAKEELFKIFFVKQALESTGAIPIKRGTFDKTAINKSIKLLKEGEVVGIFPEGTRSKSKELSLGETHNGASFIATRAKTKILPFAIIPNKNFRLFSRIKIVVGDEIDATALKESGKTHDEITEILMNSISNLIAKER